MRGKTSKSSLTPRNLNEEQTREIKEAFDLFDMDGSGRIDPHEVVLSLKTLGCDNVRKEIQEIISVLDHLPDAPIDFQEFLRIVSKTMQDRDPIEEIDKAFQRFDDDCTGKISFRNLKRASLELGEQLTDSEIKEMIRAADEDLDGEIGHDEFIALMQRETF